MSTEATIKPRYDAAIVRYQARGQWLDTLQSLAGVTLPVNREGPCPKCQGNTRCRFTDRDGDGSCYCSHCHTDGGNGFDALMWLTGCTFGEAVSRVGEYLHSTPATKATSKAKPPETTVEPAPVEVRHHVYSTILSLLPLEARHRANLIKRGLSEPAIEREQYRSLGNLSDDDRAACAAAKRELNGHAAMFDRIPGIVDGRLVIRGGILIPVRNEAGQITALKIRRDQVQGTEPRYLYQSSKHCSCGAPAHVPLSVAGPVDRVRVTEGELKATVAAELSGLATISAPSVNSWRRVIPVLQAMQAKTVLLSFDADAASNKNVAKQLAAAYAGLQAEGFAVELETWDASQGKGIDDLLLAGGQARILLGDDAEVWLQTITGESIPVVDEPAPFDEPEPGPAQPTTEQPKQAAGLEPFETMSCSQLAGSPDEEFLCRGVIVARQPNMIGGPPKSFKTTIAEDLAISLATGGHFLGYFECPRPVSCLFMSAESGLSTLRKTAESVCRQAGITWPWQDEHGEWHGDELLQKNLRWSTFLPKFGVDEELKRLDATFAANPFEVLIVDPLYKAMPSADAGNVFAAGELFAHFGRWSDANGVTLILLHHLKKSVADPFQPAELQDFAWSGFAEHARSWLLLSRREKYVPPNPHKLWISTGGSAGHGGCWGIDIDQGEFVEGQPRQWNTTLTTAAELIQEEVKTKQEAKNEAKQAEAAAKLSVNVAALLKAAAKFPDGESKTALRSTAVLNSPNMDAALAAALDRKALEPCEVFKSGKKTPIQGYRLTKPAKDEA